MYGIVRNIKSSKIHNFAHKIHYAWKIKVVMRKGERNKYETDKWVFADQYNFIWTVSFSDVAAEKRKREGERKRDIL